MYPCGLDQQTGVEGGFQKDASSLTPPPGPLTWHTSASLLGCHLLLPIVP